MVAASAALLVSTMLTGCGEAGPPDRATPQQPVATPSSVEDLPTGRPTSFALLSDGVLHVDGFSISTDADRVVHRGGTTLVGSVDEQHSRWWLVDGGRLEPLIDDATAYLVPVLSADGGTAAWRVDATVTKVDDTTSRYHWELVVFDVPSRTVLGTTGLDGDVTCCDQGGLLMITGVTNDGRVGLSGGPAGNLSIWRAGDALLPVKVRASSYSGFDPWPLGVSYVLAGDPGARVSFGRVDAAGVVTEVGWTTATAIWSADGRRVVDRVSSRSTQTSRLEVSVPVTGATVPLALPPAPDWQALGWEDDGHVVAARVSTPDAGPPTYLAVVRCEAASGACERVHASA